MSGRVSLLRPVGGVGDADRIMFSWRDAEGDVFYFVPGETGAYCSAMSRASARKKWKDMRSAGWMKE